MAKMKSALLIANYSNRTGYAWNNIYRLYNVIGRRLKEEGLSVCLSFAKIEPPVTTLDEDIQPTFFEYDPINVSLRDLYNLVVHIRRCNVKYIYATDLPAYHFSYFVMRLFGVKYLVLHSRISVPSPYPATPEQGLKRVVKKLLSRIEWINATKIYCVSNFVKQRFINKNCLQDDKLVKILNGIDISKYDCREIERGQKTMIYVGGRATKHKGIHVLFEAAEILINKKKFSEFEIYYAGDGPDIDYLKSEVERLQLSPYVYFLGELRSTEEYVCKSEIVVVPSIWGDACPSAVSEAMAAGRPLITTKAGGIPEMVGEEKNAILVEPGDKDALAEGLYLLLRNKDIRIEYGVNARKRAINAFRQELYYKKVIAQLEQDFELSCAAK